MAASLRFENLLRAAGFDDLDIVQEFPGCEIVQVRAPNAFGGTKLYVLHLKSDATWQSAKDVTLAATARGIPKDSFYAVAEPSCRLIDDKKRVARLFNVAEALDRREFLGNALKSTI